METLKIDWGFYFKASDKKQMAQHICLEISGLNYKVVTIVPKSVDKLG